MVIINFFPKYHVLRLRTLRKNIVSTPLDETKSIGNAVKQNVSGIYNFSYT